MVVATKPKATTKKKTTTARTTTPATATWNNAEFRMKHNNKIMLESTLSPKQFTAFWSRVASVINKNGAGGYSIVIDVAGPTATARGTSRTNGSR